MSDPETTEKLNETIERVNEIAKVVNRLNTIIKYLNPFLIRRHKNLQPITLQTKYVEAVEVPPNDEVDTDE